MSDAAIADIKRALIDYLKAHPNAGDTLEGIGNWWLLPRRYSPKHLLAALEQLEREGLVRREPAPRDNIWVGLS